MDLRDIIAKNISELRQSGGITQSKLAEYLNYTDKAVSKWERGEAIPDVTVLKQIADYFEVSVDYLLEETHEPPKKAPSPASRRNRFFISALAYALVWLIATFAFVEVNIFVREAAFPTWLLFIYAVPASSVVALVFNSIWGRRRLNFLIISVGIWSALLAVYLTTLAVFGHNVWLVFIIGIPAEIIVLLWSGLSIKIERSTLPE